MLEVPCVDTLCDSVESLECPTKLLLGVECGYFCLCLKSSSITVFGLFFFFNLASFAILPSKCFTPE